MGAKDRKRFANQYKVIDNENIINFGEYVRKKIEERDKAIEQISKSIQAEKTLKRGRKRRIRSSKNAKKTLKRGRKRRIRSSKNAKKTLTGKKLKGNIKAKIVAWTLSLGIAVGGLTVAHNVHENYQKQNAPATLEQVLDEGVSPEDLGISNQLVSRMQGIQEKLENKDITNEQLIRMSKEISDLQFDITKTKLSNVLGCSPEDVKLYTYGRDADGKQQETVEVYENGSRKAVYNNKNNFEKTNTIPNEVAEMIRNIPNMQYVMRQIQEGEGDINRKEIIGKYKEALDELSRFAGMQLKIDGKGNISVDVTKVSELKRDGKNKYEAAIEKAVNDGMNSTVKDNEPEL